MQKKHVSLLAVAALAVGGFVWAPSARAAGDANTAGQAPAAQTDQTARPAADKTAADTNVRDQAKDAKDIRETLAQTTEAAVKKGTFDDLSERLAAPDRQRIGKFAEQKFDDL